MKTQERLRNGSGYQVLGISVLLAAVGLVLFLSAPARAATADNADAILGTWVTGDGNAHVEISKQNDGVYTGKIVWLKELSYPADDPEAGKPRHDRHNPDTSLRDRPIVGLTILQGVKHGEGGKYSGGTIYDPKEGKTYKCNITITAPEKLKLRGFVGISLLGRNEEWTRAK